MSIPIVYFRSSSFNSHRMCPMQYYHEYTLGWRGSSGKKADKGTIVHKVLELSALCKKALQEGHSTFKDSEIGEIETSNYNPEYLDEIIDKVYEYYTSRTTHHDWKPLDLKHCRKWVWKIFDDNDGLFDPKNRVVVDAEPHFDFEVEEDWATGKEKTPAKLQNDPQLRMYHLAVKKLYPHVKSFLITIHFMNDGGPFTLHFQDSDIKETMEMIKAKFEVIKETTRPQQVKSWKCSKLCSANKVRADHEYD